MASSRPIVYFRDAPEDICSRIKTCRLLRKALGAVSITKTRLHMVGGSTSDLSFRLTGINELREYVPLLIRELNRV